MPSDAGVTAPKGSCPADKFGLSPAHAYAPGTYGLTTAAGDLNGDGKIDLLTGGGGQNSDFYSLLNKGDGTFASPVTKNMQGPGTFGIGLGDVTGDGKLDLIYGPISISPGNGDGTFGIPVSLDPTLQWSNGSKKVLLADFNADKNLDYAVMGEGDEIAVLLNAGGGMFPGGPVVINGSGSGIQDSALGDFNGDGKPDLAGPGGATNVEIFLNKGGGIFASAVSYPVPHASLKVAAGDFNADGKDDVALAWSPDGYAMNIDVLLNKGDGTFDGNRAKTYMALPDNASDFIAADLNRDGKSDLVAATYHGAVVVLMNAGDGTFAAPVTYGVSTGQLYGLSAADFAGNGLLGIAVNSDDHRVNVLLGACH
jgi:hypothetical protein